MRPSRGIRWRHLVAALALHWGFPIVCTDVCADSITTEEDSFWSNTFTTTGVTDGYFPSDIVTHSSADLWSHISSGAADELTFATPVDFHVSPRKVRLSGMLRISVLGAILLAVTVAGLYAGLHKNSGGLPWKAEQSELQTLAAAATDLADTLKDESAVELPEALGARLAAVQSALPQPNQSPAVESEPKRVEGLLQGLSGVLRPGRLEDDHNAAREITRGMQELTWERLNTAVQDVNLFCTKIAMHAETASAVAKALGTDGAIVEAALAANVASRAKRDWQALQTIMQQVKEVKAASTSDAAEAAALFEDATLYAKRIWTISRRVVRGFQQINEWRKLSGPAMLTGFLVEGAEIVSQISSFNLEAKAMNTSEKDSEALRSFFRAQQSATETFQNLRHQTCPSDALQLLDRLRQIRREAKEAFDELQKSVDDSDAGSLAAPVQSLESVRYRAEQEAKTLAIHALLANELAAGVAALEKRPPDAGGGHAQLAKLASEVTRLSNLVNAISEEGQANERQMAATESLVVAEAKAERVKELRSKAYESAQHLAHTVSLYYAWKQLDAAVMDAMPSVAVGMEALVRRPPEGYAARNARQALIKAEPTLTLQRYRFSTQVRQGKNQALALIRAARTVDALWTSRENRHLPAANRANP